MKIYDISQEVFTCTVFPGDPAPKREIMESMSEGALYNLTSIQMCAHNGTHIDAPFHFINEGATVDGLKPEHFVGPAYVAEHQGIVTGTDAVEILEKAKKAGMMLQDAICGDNPQKRILIKGDAEVSLEAAEVFAEAEILLLGNESQTVGPVNAPMAVHLTLLGANVVLLEGIRLEEVSEGTYFLNAMPLNLGGADGAPCRAILIEFE